MRAPNRVAAGALVVLLVACSTAVAQATTTAAPTTTAAATTTAGPTTTAAPAGPTLAPLNTAVSRADLLFTFFAQDAAVVQEYSRTLAGLLNVTLRRVQFESTGQGRYGYLFGEDVRVRVIIDAPVASEDEQRHASVIRDALVELAETPTHATLTEIGVVSGERVDTLEVYQYSPLTAWDIVWTLLIASGGLGFLGFCAFVAYRFNRWIKYEKMEREQAAKEKEMLELKRKAKANGSAAAAKKAAAEEKAAFERQLREEDDGDDVADGAMADLVNQLAVSYKKQYGDGGGTSVDGGGDASSSNMSPDRNTNANAESEAFTAPTDRIAVGEAQLGPTSIDGRQALHLHHGGSNTGNGPGSPARERTAVESYLDRIVLPPSGAPATYIAGVDSKVHAPPPSAATATSAPASKAPASPASTAPTTGGKPSQVGTSQVGGFQSDSASAAAKVASPTSAAPGAGATTPGGTAFSKADMDEL